MAKRKYFLTDIIIVIAIIGGLWYGLLRIGEPIVMLVQANLGATYDQELTSLEELYMDWEPPSKAPAICINGWPVGGHAYHCPESKGVALVKTYRRLKSSYMRSDPQNQVFLAWVSDQPWVTSNYGNRKHPISGRYGFHDAIDVSCKLGEPVYAVSDGLVTASFFHGSNRVGSTPGTGCGNLIDIDHGYGMGAEWGSHYCHFQTRMVKVGDHVEAGQQIGTCGSTGSSTGPHVHYRLNRNKGHVDPLEYLPEGWKYTERMKKKLGIR